ncbi:MAG: hypothetical protein ACLR5H_05585 [Oscillospiraceae bacterium]
MNVIEKLATYEDQISPGVSACVGCNVELTLRTCMKVLGPNTIFAVPPGCMGGVGVVGWDKESGAKTPVFFPCWTTWPPCWPVSRCTMSASAARSMWWPLPATAPPWTPACSACPARRSAATRSSISAMITRAT